MRAILIAMAFSAFISCVGSYKIYSLILEHQRNKITAQVSENLTKQCNAQKAVTEKVSNEYQKKLSALNLRLSAFNGLSDGRCIPIIGHSASASRHNAAPADAGYAAENARHSRGRTGH